MATSHEDTSARLFPTPQLWAQICFSCVSYTQCLSSSIFPITFACLCSSLLVFSLTSLMQMSHSTLLDYLSSPSPGASTAICLLLFDLLFKDHNIRKEILLEYSVYHILWSLHLASDKYFTLLTVKRECLICIPFCLYSLIDCFL